MYEYLHGILVELQPEKAVIDISGIGYALAIPKSTYTQLVQKLDSEVKLYTAHIVREDSERLFGFLTHSHRDLFFKLSDISGIGPKTALNILGHFEDDTLIQTIQQGDVASLAKAPGIGKKTAERLVMELKDRLHTFAFLDKIITPKTHSNPLHQDAIRALVNLGYSTKTATAALHKCLSGEENEPELPELITKALQHV